MFAMHDNGGIGYTSPPANNPFDYLDGEWATSAGIPAQHGPHVLPDVPDAAGASAPSVTYFYGSGNRFARRISATPYGKTGTNRLNLTNYRRRRGQHRHSGGRRRPIRRTGGDHLGHGDPA